MTLLLPPDLMEGRGGSAAVQLPPVAFIDSRFGQALTWFALDVYRQHRGEEAGHVEVQEVQTPGNGQLIVRFRGGWSVAIGTAAQADGMPGSEIQTVKVEQRICGLPYQRATFREYGDDVWGCDCTGEGTVVLHR